MYVKKYPKHVCKCFRAHAIASTGIFDWQLMPQICSLYCGHAQIYYYSKQCISIRFMFVFSVLYLKKTTKASPSVKQKDFSVQTLLHSSMQV